MKKNRILKAIPAICLFLLAAANAYAGAWTTEQGKSYHRFALNHYVADESFDESGHSDPMLWNGEFTDFNANYYMEYGALDELTAILSLYYKDIQREDDYYRYTTRGFGDVDMGLRYRLHTSDIGVFSIQGLVKLPMLYDEEDPLPLGNGQYDVECRVLYGRSLWPWIPGYMNLETAYRLRADNPADEFRYLVEVGSNLGKVFYARAKWDAIIGMNNADEATDAYGNPTSALEYDLSKLDFTVGWQMKQKIGLELGYAPAILGETTAKGDTWTLAITFQPKR